MVICDELWVADAVAVLREAALTREVFDAVSKARDLGEIAHVRLASERTRLLCGWLRCLGEVSDQVVDVILTLDATEHHPVVADEAPGAQKKAPLTSEWDDDLDDHQLRRLRASAREMVRPA